MFSLKKIIELCCNQDTAVQHSCQSVYFCSIEAAKDMAVLTGGVIRTVHAAGGGLAPALTSASA